MDIQPVFTLVQVTGPNHVIDFEIPEYVFVRGEKIIIPKILKKKSFKDNVIDDKIVKTCFINPILAYILRASLTEDTCEDLTLALQFGHLEITKLVKQEYVSGKVQQGFMGLAQTHCNIPEDAICITRRTYEALVEEDRSLWKDLSSCYITRYPNLGPDTTSKLRLLVLEETGESLGFGSVDGIFDALYIHPETLKNKFEGDADGDILFMAPSENLGVNYFQLKIQRTESESSLKNFEAEGKNYTEEILKKSKRFSRERSLSQHLSECLEPALIGQVTYNTRSAAYLEAKNTGKTLKEAWMKVSPEGLRTVETVMDIRKGGMSKKQIDEFTDKVNKDFRNVVNLKKAGDLFHSVVTSATIPEDFPFRFHSLNDFAKELFEIK